MTAAELIALLELRPLPLEGGYYRETFRAGARLPVDGRDKSAGTAIYYCLTPDTFSALHRLPTEEVFHFYLGDPVDMLQLFPDGTGRVVTLGTNLAVGERPQLVVPRGVWQGSALRPDGKLALLGTTMSPGFDFDDYEGGTRAALIERYPAFARQIERLTRE